MIVFTAHFKDVEQKVGFSVAFVVLNGLQERFVLWERSMCLVIGAVGSMGGRVSVFSYLRDVDGQAQVGSAELHCVATLYCICMGLTKYPYNFWEAYPLVLSSFIKCSISRELLSM